MLKMPMVFSDHMILQRHKPVAVWGEAQSNQQVLVRLLKDGAPVAQTETVSLESGSWMIHLPAMEADRNLELHILSGESHIFFRDVLIGEVWIAGGQSNMEYYLHFDAEKDIPLSKPENPDIRFFDYPEVSFEGALEQYDFPDQGFWRRCRTEDLPWFSAVGYYFSENLQQALDVPVGIVGCNWGGTKACCWMAPEYLENTPGQIWLDEYKRSLDGVNIEEYNRWYTENPANIPNHPIPGDFPVILYPGLTRDQQLQALKAMEQLPQNSYANLIGPVHPWRPCGLYETMLKKIVPYTAKGVLWYQGESDEAHPKIYTNVLSSMIRNWRDLWKDELPFLIVQLAPFGAWLHTDGSNYPIVRNCQEAVCEKVPGTFLCSSSDCGMEWDIHPKHKQPIGHRLALLARGHIYAENILCDAPALDCVQRTGNTAVLHFKNAEGLHLGNDDTIVNNLLVNGQPCQAQIAGETLILHLPEAERWTIELANCGYYEVNLYNSAGIPAIPFAVNIEK